MSANKNYNINLIKLYEYKYQTNVLTKEQFFSIKNFIENNDEKFVRSNINAFEAYINLFPDTIIPVFPLNFEYSFFENLLKILNVKIPKKISSGWNNLYLSKLVKAVKSSLNDKITKNSFTGFFEKALTDDFKKIQLRKFKKENLNNLKNLNQANFNFEKWSENRLTKTYSIQKESELKIILNECSFLLYKALGTKKNSGIIKNNKKAFSRCASYLTDGKINDINAVIPIIDIIKNFSYCCDTEKEIFFRNSVSILEKRINDINLLPENVTFSFWERNPIKEIFIGSEIDTCLSVTRGSFFCLLDYFMDFFVNVITVKSNEKIIGLSYVFIIEDTNKNISLLFDNFELSDEYKHISFCADEFIDYTFFVAKEFNVKNFYIGKNYNDCLLPPLPDCNIYFKKFALQKNRKYYLDTFNGFAVPEGNVSVNFLTL